MTGYMVGPTSPSSMAFNSSTEAWASPASARPAATIKFESAPLIKGVCRRRLQGLLTVCSGVGQFAQPSRDEAQGAVYGIAARDCPAIRNRIPASHRAAAALRYHYSPAYKWVSPVSMGFVTRKSLVSRKPSCQSATSCRAASKSSRYKEDRQAAPLSP